MKMVHYTLLSRKKSAIRELLYHSDHTSKNILCTSSIASSSTEQAVPLWMDQRVAQFNLKEGKLELAIDAHF